MHVLKRKESISLSIPLKCWMLRWEIPWQLIYLRLSRHQEKIFLQSLCHNRFLPTDFIDLHISRRWQFTGFVNAELYFDLWVKSLFWGQLLRDRSPYYFHAQSLWFSYSLDNIFFPLLLLDQVIYDFSLILCLIFDKVVEQFACKLQLCASTFTIQNTELAIDACSFWV